MTGAPVVEDLGPALHVVGGDSAAGLLRQALGLRGRDILVCEDELAFGPAPATEDLAQWRSVREPYLRQMHIDWPEFSFAEYAEEALFMNADRLGREKTVVWVGTGLSEQLLLAWIVYLCDRLGFDPTALRIVQFEHCGGRFPVLAIGEISPERIRKYCPAPYHLSAMELQELRRVWRVYTSSDPRELTDYLEGASAMPLLHRAIRELVYRYPEVRSGISIWDERLLRHTGASYTKAARVIGSILADSFDGGFDDADDRYLFCRLVALGSSRLTTPLVTIRGSHVEMRACEVRLTDFGKQVLGGNANHVLQNGIDDWIGGVHLTTDRPVTYRDGDSLRQA